jgi:hypothetical protein
LHHLKNESLNLTRPDATPHLTSKSSGGSTRHPGAPNIQVRNFVQIPGFVKSTKIPTLKYHISHHSTTTDFSPITSTTNFTITLQNFTRGYIKSHYPSERTKTGGKDINTSSPTKTKYIHISFQKIFVWNTPLLSAYTIMDTLLQKYVISPVG